MFNLVVLASDIVILVPKICNVITYIKEKQFSISSSQIFMKIFKCKILYLLYESHYGMSESKINVC